MSGVMNAVAHTLPWGVLAITFWILILGEQLPKMPRSALIPPLFWGVLGSLRSPC